MGGIHPERKMSREKIEISIDILFIIPPPLNTTL
jgi:hypothetical protein